MFTQSAIDIFRRSISDYHIRNDVDTPISNPYEEGSIENLLYLKNWIDTVQWHLEDIIRDPDISPEKALAIKHRIDSSNQDRTDLVEKIDDWFMASCKDVPLEDGASMNTETPAWAIDRLSILQLKIYHMKEESERLSASPEHRKKCREKLSVLLDQNKDFSSAIETLLEDLQSGRKYMKLYRQMKMYNDPSTNPVLYKKG
jgi:FtsZ-binding cell division protein ZapB